MTSAHADIKVVDDTGRNIILNAQAKRVISLAPHITEQLFAAGATNQIVGVVSFSDYPEQAKTIQRIGTHDKYDYEAIYQLKPDLIIAWKSANKAGVKKLIDLGFKVFISESKSLEDVAKTTRLFGDLLDTKSIAYQQADAFLSKLNDLRRNYDDRKKISVFYQVWNEPLYTINGEHIINDVINLCGGMNVFSHLTVLAPRVSVEAVIKQNPDAIIAGMNEDRKGWLESWKQWQGLKAVKNNFLFPINADLITRHTPRILLGVEKMCEHLDVVRSVN